MRTLIKTYIENNHVVFDTLGIRAKFRLNYPLNYNYSKIKEEAAAFKESDRVKNLIFEYLPMVKSVISTEALSVVKYQPKVLNEYLKFYFSDNFAKDLENLCTNMSEADIKFAKTIILRNIVLAFLLKDSFYSEDEINALNKYQQDIAKCGVSSGIFECGKWKFVNDNYEKNVILIGLGLDKIENLDCVKNKDILDLGACVGDSSFVLSEYTNKKVYAFEPLEKNFMELRQNIELNKVSNIEIVKKGCGEKSQNLKLSNSKYGGKFASFEKKRTDMLDCLEYEEGSSVEIISIDDFVKENNLEIGIIKIDIEGYEMNALKGAMETIKNQRPVLLISVYHKAEDFFYIKPFIESLNLDYKFSYCDNLPGEYVSDNILICEAKNV